MKKIISILMKRKVTIFLSLFFAVVIMFFPLKPIVKDVDEIEIVNITVYYKGQPEEDITDYVKLDTLEFLLQLYNTSMIPTVFRG